MNSNKPANNSAQTQHEVVPLRLQCGKLLRLPMVEEKTGFKKSSIYAGVKAGTFPAPVRLSARAVGWREEAIDLWITERVQTGVQQ